LKKWRLTRLKRARLLNPLADYTACDEIVNPSPLNSLIEGPLSFRKGIKVSSLPVWKRSEDQRTPQRRYVYFVLHTSYKLFSIFIYQDRS
jgi:hypothetical protein